MNEKIALITGITGQDGSYLADFLLGKGGYKIIGLTRDPTAGFKENIAHLEDRVKLLFCDYTRSSLTRIIEEHGPNEIYNFAGQSYVGKSWMMIEETQRVSGVIPVEILEAIVDTESNSKFFQASSSQIFSPNATGSLTELSSLGPYTPYGCSKLYAHSMVQSFRENYGVFASNGIFFNHESTRRNDDFLCKKIARSVAEIKLKRSFELFLGNIDLERDLGFAPEFVEGAYLCLQHDVADDFNFCTGVKTKIKDLVEDAFKYVGLVSSDYVKSDKGLVRAKEAQTIVGSYGKAKNNLGWYPKTSILDVMKMMIDSELNKLNHGHGQ